MAYKKRRKSGRLRGSKTHARGFKKKARGSGHRGGVGMAGTGKRGDQKKTLVLNLYGNSYFGKDKTLRKGHVPVKLKVINLQQISDNLNSFVQKGLAKDNKGTYELDLSEYKILSDGELSVKATIKAHSASKSAVDKAAKSGSKIEIKSEDKE